MLENEKAFLFELRGQSPGATLGLTRDVFRIGCDTDNDLILQEEGVALYQAEIRLENQQFVIRNLSAEGPVFLNGEPFEKALLRKGDILTVGDSIYRFVPDGEALTQEELWRPVGGRKGPVRPAFRTPKRAVLVAVLCLVAAAAVYWVAATRGPGKDLPPVSEADRDRDRVASRAMDPRVLGALYDRGVDLMATRHWDQALVLLEQVRIEAPGYRDVEGLYRQGLMESQAALRFNQARGYLVEGVPLLAGQALRQIPGTSVLYREADRMIREIDRRVLSARLDRARKYMAEGDWLGARGEITAILEDEPQNEEAAVLLRQIDRLQGTPGAGWHFVRREDDPPGLPAAPAPAGRVVVPEERVPPSTPAGAPPSARPADAVAAVTRPPPRPAAPPSPLDRARAAYLRGDADASLAELKRILDRGPGEEIAREARRMQSDVFSAKNWFLQAETLQEQGRSAEAVEMWDRFLEKDREVAGKGESALFRRASARLSRLYHDRGKEAFDAGDAITAARFWRMGARIDPGNPDLKTGMELLAESAQKVYREGYSLQEINPRAAVERWRVVLEIVPPGHPYHERAKAGIERRSSLP